MRLLLASNNAKKLSELQTLIAAAGLAVELLPQAALQISEAEEPHATFIENALAKARHAAAAGGRAAIADDSGVCVDALDGAPGVISAHYAGVVEPGADREATRRAQDARNNAMLLDRLASVPDGDARRAHFISTLVALRRADDPQPLVAVGRWPGRILLAPRGSGGFGYDPLMFIPDLNRTVAELDAATKNAHSHRALAMAQMLDLLRAVWNA
ncbi:MAG: non-canonical purine NTP pyrophosphatase [Pseudomonadota bacterium]|nr:non-canonical purine NTP pyrophosphatase [Pseudomonadota bacterium]